MTAIGSDIESTAGTIYSINLGCCVLTGLLEADEEAHLSRAPLVQAPSAAYQERAHCAVRKQLAERDGLRTGGTATWRNMMCADGVSEVTNAYAAATVRTPCAQCAGQMSSCRLHGFTIRTGAAKQERTTMRNRRAAASWARDHIDHSTLRSACAHEVTRTLAMRSGSTSRDALAPLASPACRCCCSSRSCRSSVAGDDCAVGDSGDLRVSSAKGLRSHGCPAQPVIPVLGQWTSDAW